MVEIRVRAQGFAGGLGASRRARAFPARARGTFDKMVCSWRVILFGFCSVRVSASL